MVAATATRQPLKRPPNPNELVFIDQARGIRERRITSQQQINPALAGNLCDIATELLHATAQEPGDFWKTYDALSNHDKRLKSWRKAIEVQAAPGVQAQEALYDGTLLSDVKFKPVDWIWKPRLARGKIVLLDGDPGLGKSLIGAYLAKCITQGTNMPDGTPCTGAGGVVVIMPEDGLEDTIQPRFARAGADLTKVVSIGTVKDRDSAGNPMERVFSIDRDLPLLEAAINRVHASLLYIDPIMAIVGAAHDVYKDPAVRDMLNPLKMLVEKTNVACVMVRHMTKARGDNPLMAGAASIAFIGLSRGGLMVVRDPEDDTQAILAHIKSNIGPLGEGLKYKIMSDADQGDERPYLRWNGTTTLSGADLINPPHRNTGSNRNEILALLVKHKPDEVELQAIIDTLPEVSSDTIKMTLSRMYKAGEIEKSARGLYHAK